MPVIKLAMIGKGGNLNGVETGLIRIIRILVKTLLEIRLMMTRFQDTQ